MTSNPSKGTFIPALPSQAAGIGLRGKHYQDLLDQKPDIGWIEVHPENYFGGGLHRHYLSKARALYPLSFHAVGLSLGSDQPVSQDHIDKIRELVTIYEPFQISDHASWSASDNAHLNDLLPLPYTKETLDRLCDNIDRVQNGLGRKILLENPSTYVAFAISEMPEYEFMNEAARRSGCDILLDVNNIFVQAFNHDFDARLYLDQIDAGKVKEIHLAGHTERRFDDGTLLIDTHNRPVREEVWDLYRHAIRRFGAVPSLIEWDGDIPELPVLVAEADKARDIVNDAISREHTDEAA